MAELVSRLAAWTLDDGTDHFDPSSLAFTTVDVGNPATNVIPAEARAGFNIRFNDRHNSAGLIAHIEAEAAAVEKARGVAIAVAAHVSGEPFLTKPGAFTAMLSRVVQETTGQVPDLSTTAAPRMRASSRITARWWRWDCRRYHAQGGRMRAGGGDREADDAL
ncbi:MAG: peptidase dimerization domain-containing protein [Rhizomicrobium sp.]